MTNKLHQRYEEAIANLPPDGRAMPYRWGNLPDPLSCIWLPYRQMFDEFSQAISNGINTLSSYVHRLRAWSAVSDGMGEDELFEANFSFIDPLATVALNLPYVIQNRMLFATAHLCHQANQARTPNWTDDLRLDTEIDQSDADRHGDGWKKYGKLKTSLERVDSSQYRRDTRDFRNAYTHRFPPMIVIGISQTVTRKVDAASGRASYAIGGAGPLTLEVIDRALTQQRDASYRAFDAFQKLIREQETAIVSWNGNCEERGGAE